MALRSNRATRRPERSRPRSCSPCTISSGAFAAADGLVGEDPSQLGAVATRFDAELELGRLDQARADIERLAEIGGPAVTIRAARLASVTGDPGERAREARAARPRAADEVDGLRRSTHTPWASTPGWRAMPPLARDGVPRRAGGSRGMTRPRCSASPGSRHSTDAWPTPSPGTGGARRRSPPAGSPGPARRPPGEQLSTRRGGAPFATVRFIEELGDLQRATYDRNCCGSSSTTTARPRASSMLPGLRSPPAGRPWHDLIAWCVVPARPLRRGRVGDRPPRGRSGADDARSGFHQGAIELARGNEGDGTGCCSSRGPWPSALPSIRSNARKRRRCSTVEQADRRQAGRRFGRGRDVLVQVEDVVRVVLGRLSSARRAAAREG